MGKPAGESEAGARKALNKPEKSWDLLVCIIRPSVLPGSAELGPENMPPPEKFQGAP